MVIRLYETKEKRNLIIELYERPSLFTVEIQPGLFYGYDEGLVLTQIDVRDDKLIDPILHQMEELLRMADIKIVRKAA